MPAICDAAIHLCRIRITRLDSVGHPAAGPNNVYVSDKPISLGVTPQVEAGQDLTLVGGCDCIIAAYRGNDKLKRFDFELATGILEPALTEMLIGAPVRVDGSGTVIGVDWPNQLTCSAGAQPAVAFEGWQDAWEEDAPDPLLPYVHWVWPATKWQIGDFTLANEFNQPSFTGFSRGNTQWGIGPYGDLSSEIGAHGGYEFTDTIPDAFCGYLSQHVS